MNPEYKEPLFEEAEPTEIEHLGSLAERMVYRLPGCADLMIRMELQNAWYDFANKTSLLRFDMKAPLVLHQHRYEFKVPCDAVIKEMRNVRLGCMRPHRHHRHHYHHFHTWIMGDHIREGLGGHGERPFIELLFPVDEDLLKHEDTVFCQLECRPKMGSEAIPRWIYDKYADAIVNGAMYRLCSMTGKPWSDAAVATDALRIYENAMNEASINAISNNTGKLIATNFEGWA